MTRGAHVAAAVTFVAITTWSAGWSGAGSVPPTTPTTPASTAASGAPTSDHSTAPTSASSAPAEPSSTVDPAAALEAAISDAAVHATAAARNALFHPDDPSAIDALGQWYVAGSPARARVDRLVQARRDSARLLRPHPDVADATTVEQVLPGAGDAPTRAGVVVCVVEASEEVASGTGQAVGQDVTSYRTVYEMNLVEGHWQLLTSSVLQTWSSTAECAPPTEAITLAAEVTVRISEIDAIRTGVVVDPDASTADERLRSVLVDDGDTIAGTRDFIETMRNEGHEVRIGPGRPPAVTVERVGALDGPQVTRVDVAVCGIDPLILFEPAGGPDGQDAIVDDLIYAYRSLWRLMVEDGSWQVESIEITDQWTGVVECPPS